MTAVGGMNPRKFYPFVIIPDGKIKEQHEDRNPGRLSVIYKYICVYISKSTFSNLMYGSLSLSKHVRLICSPLILFLSSSVVGSEGYMERCGPVRQITALT